MSVFSLASVIQQQIHVYFDAKQMAKEPLTHKDYKVWVKNQPGYVSIREADELALYHAVEAERGVEPSAKGRRAIDSNAVSKAIEVVPSTTAEETFAPAAAPSPRTAAPPIDMFPSNHVIETVNDAPSVVMIAPTVPTSSPSTSSPSTLAPAAAFAFLTSLSS